MMIDRELQPMRRYGHRHAGTAIVLAAAALLQTSAAARVLDRVVARVDGEVITRSDVEKVLKQGGVVFGAGAADDEPMAWALDELIAFKLLLVGARARGLTATEEELTQEFDRTAAREGAAQAMTEGVRQQLQEILLVRKFVEARVGGRSREPVREELESYYGKHLEEFGEPEKSTLRVISVQAENGEQRQQAHRKVEAILAKLREGEDFGALSREYSSGPVAGRDGLIGTVERSALRDEVAGALKMLKPGEHSGVIETSEGFQIVKLEEVIPARARDFEEVREQVRVRVIQRKREEALRELVGGLRRDATVEIRD